MPLPPRDKPDWQIKQEAYQHTHRGYCGLCGLPEQHCFHRDPEYMRQVMTHVNAIDIQASIKLKEKHYQQALDSMTDLELESLPEPPRKWLSKILEKTRLARILPLNVWDRLNQDTVL